LLTGLSFLFGLRISPEAFLVALLLIALLAASFASLSYGAALLVKNENALAPMVNSLALPILLLSGILLPMSLAPKWLQVVSDFNPIKHVVTGLRAAFRGDALSTSTLIAFAIASVIAVLSVLAGARAMKNLAN
ncbi:MAG TPA: ABC transporter permease, partial [Devosia sp.]|nr:ABC transporter permease [Devosia sp.]